MRGGGLAYQDRGLLDCTDGGHEGHWLIGWHRKGGGLFGPRIPSGEAAPAGRPGRPGALGGPADSAQLSVVPTPYSLCDQLLTTLFPKNKHAYGIGGSFVAIKGNNRVFKKIALRFKYPA